MHVRTVCIFHLCAYSRAQTPITVLAQQVPLASKPSLWPFDFNVLERVSHHRLGCSIYSPNWS